MLHTARLRRGPAQLLAIPSSIPASVGGLDTVSPLADMPADRAVQLDNWVPRPGWLEIRRGSQNWATGMGSTTSVETLMTYAAPGGMRQFAIAGGKIYETTSGGAVGAALVSGLSSSRWQYVNFQNSIGTNYIVLVDGIDTPQSFNGTAFANFSPSGVTPSSLVNIGAWKGFLWLIPLSSQTAYFMPQFAVAGAASAFPLGSLMDLGGYLVAVGTWSADTRQTVDDYLAFVTSRGQVIVYQGTNPADANAFALNGVYKIAPPIGYRCLRRIAGDLHVITLEGIMSMAQMLSTDRAAANRVSVSSLIMNALNQQARQFAANFGWQFMTYPKGTLAILNVPTTVNSVAIQYAMNTLTGAWCRFLGLNANCWETFNDIPYFGTNNGTVQQWDTDSADGTTPITATVGTAFNYFGSRGRLKKWNMIRPILTTDGQINPGVGLNIDFGQGAPITIPSAPASFAATWDNAIWDTSTWPNVGGTAANWTTVSGIGQCASILSQATSNKTGNANGVTLQLNGWDIIAEPGGII